MKVRIEIDLNPDEFRQFLGLPDVGGMQEDLLNYAKEKFAQTSDNFDAASFVKDTISGKRAANVWRKLIDATLGPDEDQDDEDSTPKSRRKTATKNDKPTPKRPKPRS